MTNAIHEGRDAYYDGLDQEDCPYEPGVAYDDWQAGWCDALENDLED